MGYLLPAEAWPAGSHPVRITTNPSADKDASRITWDLRVQNVPSSTKSGRMLRPSWSTCERSMGHSAIVNIRAASRYLRQTCCPTTGLPRQRQFHPLTWECTRERTAAPEATAEGTGFRHRSGVNTTTGQRATRSSVVPRRHTPFTNQMSSKEFLRDSGEILCLLKGGQISILYVL